MATCQHRDCKEVPVARMFGPGKPSILVCSEHMNQGQSIASAMGFYLEFQLIAEEALDG